MINGLGLDPSIRGKTPNGQRANPMGGRQAGRGHSPDRTDSAKRPARVECKVRVSDWEADTIIGSL